MPQFAHLPLLLKPDGNGKLSKRDGDRLGFPVFPLKWQDPFTEEISSGYRENGYIPAAFINMLALLGWNPGTPQEIFSMSELIEAFSIERISKSGAKFDAAKTKWFNQQYLRQTPSEDLAKIFATEIQDKGFDYPITYIQAVCELVKEKAQFSNEFWSLASYFFEEPTSFDMDLVRKKWKDAVPAFMANLALAFNSTESFDALSIEDLFKACAEKNGIGAGAVMQIFRIAISGQAAGPAIFELTSLIGKERIVKRLNIAIDQFNSIA
jgi:glutamyl-tRNA synthetase